MLLAPQGLLLESGNLTQLIASIPTIQVTLKSGAATLTLQRDRITPRGWCSHICTLTSLNYREAQSGVTGNSASEPWTLESLASL